MKIELDLRPEQVQQLREVIDAVPMNHAGTSYLPLIATVLKALPMTDIVSSPMSDSLSRVLRNRLPHGSSL